MRLNVCFNEVALFGPFAALIKSCSSFGRNEVSPQKDMAIPQGMKVFAVRNIGVLKISCIFLLCVECNSRHSYLCGIGRVSGVRYSGRHRESLCA